MRQVVRSERKLHAQAGKLDWKSGRLEDWNMERNCMHKSSIVIRIENLHTRMRTS